MKNPRLLVGLVLVLTLLFPLAACQSSATIAPTVTSTPAPMPLSQAGPYAVGVRKMIKYTDASRGDRPVTLTIWYPADPSTATANREPVTDAAPDTSKAPYPVILSSTKLGFVFGSHMASHGFVVVGVNGQDSKDHWGTWLTDYPLDLVFALDQVASNPPDGLGGLLDTDHAGAMGYSFDGYTSLALSGARADPEFFHTQCEQAGTMNPPPAEWWVDYICNMTGGWENFVANAGSAVTTSEDGLWQPMTDERIRAVMPMAPEGAWLFGERGLAAVDRPTLIIGATDDTINIYNLEAVYIFEHIRNPAPTMVSFIGQVHGMIDDPNMVARMKHFAVAFFGVHLQGRTDYANYFSSEFVSTYNDLAWGVYRK